MRLRSLLGSTAVALALGAPAADAQAYQVTLLTAPGATDAELATSVNGINAAGQVVGNVYYNGLKPGGTTGGGLGFLYDAGVFSRIVAPYAPFATGPAAINDAGVVVGSTGSAAGIQGFVDSAGVFRRLDAPGTAGNPIGAFTSAHGINDAGQVVGTYVDPNRRTHSFLEQGGVFTTIDVPFASGSPLFGDSGPMTDAAAINNLGQIVGQYSGGFRNATFYTYGFLRDADGGFTSITFPGAAYTALTGINDAGYVVGLASGGLPDPTGFVYHDGVFRTFTLPGSDLGRARPLGINDAGQIVGTYGAYGFIATPLAVTAPEPTTLVLLGAGLVGFGAVARRRPTVVRNL